MITWYINRLRTMSGPEILFRIRQQLQKIIEKHTAGRRKKNYHFTLNPDALLKRGERLPHIEYSDTIHIFGIPFKYTEPINWHHDIFTNHEFPHIFSKDIQVQSGKYGSVKHVWEINRLLFLPWICYNYVNTEDLKYIKQFTSITRSWIKENPYLRGVNWYSNIEINIRLINWFFCWEILNVPRIIETLPDFKEFVYRDWLPSIYLHCKYSYRNPSKYSSANNHVISEFAGLFIASSLWKFKESEKWNTYAKKGLEREINKQHSKNGINKEEAAEYIQFITDFLLISYVIGENTGNSFSLRYKQILRNVFQYIYNFTDINVKTPRYGDDDNGRVVLFDPEKNNFRSLLTSAAILFQNPVFKSKSAGFDMKNDILFGTKGRRVFHSLDDAKQVFNSCFYEEEGHYIFRSHQNRREIFIHFDAAPLGYLSIAAHGHADALSFILHINGQEVLVDSGTYCYHTDPIFRQYFIGTLAHNTIRINKKNQAQNGGPTLWLNHYKTHLIRSYSNKEYDKITASHNGYKNIGVIHTREFVYNKNNNEIVIRDMIECKQEASLFVEFPLHIHPTLHPVNDSGLVALHNSYDKPIVAISVDPKFEFDVLCGNKKPFLGWYSDAFFQVKPTSVIYQKTNIQNTTTFSTKIKIH